MDFEKRKKIQFGKEDKSHEGRFDEDIKKLCEKINRKKSSILPAAVQEE